MGWLVLIQFDRSKGAQDKSYLFEVDYSLFLAVMSQHVTSNH